MGVYQGTAGAVGIGFVSDVAQILVDIVDPGTSLVVLKPRSGRVSPKGSTTPEGHEKSLNNLGSKVYLRSLQIELIFSLKNT